MKKIVIWYRLEDNSRLSKNTETIYWFLSEEEAKASAYESYGSVETFGGSDIHKLAINNGY